MGHFGFKKRVAAVTLAATMIITPTASASPTYPTLTSRTYSSSLQGLAHAIENLPCAIGIDSLCKPDTPAPKPSPAPKPVPAPAPAPNLDSQDAEAIRELNAYRASHGRRPVSYHPGLDAAAQQWADYLAATGKFSKEDHDSRPDHIAYPGVEYGAENMAIPLHNNATSCIDSWKESTKGHRENMLNPEHRFVGHGFAIYKKGKHTGRLICVQKFGR